MDGMDRLLTAFIIFAVIDLIGVYISATTVRRILKDGIKVKKGGK